jgi:hypothetical protein
VTTVVFDPRAVVGRWQFQLDARLRAFHRARLAEKLPDPAALEQAMVDVEREAASSHFEVSVTGELVSYLDGAAYFRTRLDLAGGPVASLTIEKPTGPVTLRLTGADTLVMLDPERGELEYRRAGSADRG